MLRNALAFTCVGAAGLLLAFTASGGIAKKPPKPGPPTTTVVETTTTIQTTTQTTTATTTTVAPAPPAPPPVQLADVSVATISPQAAPLYAGSTVTYTSVVTNDGPDEATGVYVSFDLQGASVAGVAATAGSCTDGAQVECALGSLGDGASATVTLTLVPTTNAPELELVAHAGADEADPQVGNNTASASDRVLQGHAGAPNLVAPGGEFAPPLSARPAGDARVVQTSVYVDERATLFVTIADASGRTVRLLPGTLVDYLPAHRPHAVIPHLVATAGWVPLSLHFASPAGKVYKVVVRAVAPNGAVATLATHFRT